MSKSESRKAGSRAGSGVSFLTALLLFAASLSVAGQQVALSANDLAKRVDDHYNHLQTLKASFKEQYDGLGMHRSEAGVMMLRKPGRMRWEYQSTAGKVFVLDGKYAWFYAPGDTQVQRIAASQLDDLRSPLRFLLGHTKIESELQGLTLATGPGGTYTLSGQPKGQQKRIAKLSLTVTAAGAITGILIVEADGAETRFNFTDEAANTSIPDAAFHFAPPAGVPVVDALPPV
ncbi:outer membrane lipoprotein chaperone LolA [Acidicapsa acidisoli]|uniref:outer membrane lipoprotein chaperone LolA n=1 Tax=Acidicapsa acidisoli TaxID=1615681 RepID=UPI0021E00671|nr:outer membrane lipoprotein chaperone LolA [Acidicapsa acidisoli]